MAQQPRRSRCLTGILTARHGPSALALIEIDARLRIKDNILGAAMAQRVVFASDLSAKDIPDGERVEIRVLELEGLSMPVKLDASKTEADRLRVENTSLALLELVMPDGETVRVAMPADQFKKSIKGDADEVLANAEGLSFTPPPQEPRRRGRPRGDGGAASGGQRPKRDKAQVQAIREWSREHGWPDLSDRGRIPLAAEEAYNAAHPEA